MACDLLIVCADKQKFCYGLAPQSVRHIAFKADLQSEACRTLLAGRSILKATTSCGTIQLRFRDLGNLVLVALPLEGTVGLRCFCVEVDDHISTQTAGKRTTQVPIACTTNIVSGADVLQHLKGAYMDACIRNRTP